MTARQPPPFLSHTSFPRKSVKVRQMNHHLLEEMDRTDWKGNCSFSWDGKKKKSLVTASSKTLALVLVYALTTLPETMQTAPRRD